MTSEIPPASYRSDAVYRPPGVMSATIGVRAAIVSNSSIESGMPISWAERQQVEHGVGRATGRGDGRDGVVDRRPGHDRRRPDVVPDERHRQLAGLAGRCVLRRILGRDAVQARG